MAKVMEMKIGHLGFLQSQMETSADIALILLRHNALGCNVIQHGITEEGLESPHAGHLPIVVPTPCGMLFDIPVQQFRECPLLLCRFLKESPLRRSGP